MSLSLHKDPALWTPAHHSLLVIVVISNDVQEAARQASNLLPQTVPVAQRRQPGRVKTAITDTDDDLFMRLLKNSWPSKLLYYSRTMSGNVGLATLQSSL